MSLFIGGPADGEHRAVKDNAPVYRIRESPKLTPWSICYADTATMKFIDHDYTRIKMAGGNHVYLHESLHPMQIIDFLLSGYRNPNSPFKRP